MMPARRPTWAELSPDPTSRDILASLVRRRFDLGACIEGRARLQLAGAVISLTVDQDDPRIITRVTYGRRTMTPKEAARWLDEGRPW